MEQSNIEEKADMLDRIMIEWFLHADEDRDWTYLYDLFEESTDKFYSPIGVIDDPCYDSLAETKKFKDDPLTNDEMDHILKNMEEAEE